MNKNPKTEKLGAQVAVFIESIVEREEEVIVRQRDIRKMFDIPALR